MTVYQNGNDFIKENDAFLQKEPEATSLFYVDAAAMPVTDRENYALRVDTPDGALFAIRTAPYALLLYGNAAGLPELCLRLVEKDYYRDAFLCNTEIGDIAAETFLSVAGETYDVALAMEFMRTDTRFAPSSPDVIPLCDADIPDLLVCDRAFIADCGLHDTVSEDDIRKKLPAFRAVKVNGEIAAMACFSYTDTTARITNVYTRPAYRGKGYARKVVNALMNEIFDRGLTPTLNVDRKNPISNHLYRSLGFYPVFRQTEYRKKS